MISLIRDLEVFMKRKILAAIYVTVIGMTIPSLFLKV